jgi:phosphonate transport system substrate-binding protein
VVPEEGRCVRAGPPKTSRRGVLTALAATVALRGAFALPAVAASAVTFGLNPLFLDSDIQLLSMIQTYLAKRLDRPVQLTKRRTYQEITAMLLSGQLDAAWICDDPYVQHQDQLSLLATPLYRNEPLYQTYIIAGGTSQAKSFDDIKGTIHAFSDPDSTSGYLVTRYLLALQHATPAEYFRDSFFTYGHRNVVRAVASGLAGSGSVDGYVWDVMSEREPELISKTRVVYRSERLGFPPIVGLRAPRDPALAKSLSEAFIAMPYDPLGKEILGILKLDGFAQEPPDLYHSTLEKWLLVKAQV